MDINKLPKWAQDHIKDVERERDTAIQALHEYLDAQAVSEIFTKDVLSLGEQKGPSFVRRYIQGDLVSFHHAEIDLDVSVFPAKEIELRYRSSIGEEVAIIPYSYRNLRLISKSNLR